MKKTYLSLICLLLAVLTLSNAQTKIIVAAKSAIINWGIVPNTKEIVPEAPDGAATLLEKYNGFYVKDTDQKQVYLTFDLGYEAGYTAEVLDILSQHNIKAIFFLCGNYLKEQELVARMIADGHIIGNHTNKHKDLPTLSEQGIEKDITEFTQMFAEKFNQPLTYFRPPQGRLCQKSLTVANALGLKTAMWSIAIKDWGKTPIDAEKNANRIASRVHCGAVVLLHISNSGTPKMLKLLIPQLLEKGYTFGNPEEL